MNSKSQYAKAIGLEYKENSNSSPTVVVKGEQLMADEVVRIAKRYGIPIVEKPELAHALSQVETDKSIPETLFQAVALLFRELEGRFFSSRRST